MSEETQMEETLENQEETTSTEETQKTNQQDGSENERRLFARAKKAEEEVKTLKEQLKEKEVAKKEVETTPQSSPINEVDLAKKVKALADLDEAEISFAEIYAKGKGIDILEAIKSEDVGTYIAARREKIKKDNLTPDPSNKQSLTSKTVEEVLESGNFKDLSLEEKERLIKEADKKYRG